MGEAILLSLCVGRGLGAEECLISYHQHKRGIGMLNIRALS